MIHAAQPLGGVRVRLAQDTRHLHHYLHDAPVFLPLSSPAITEAQYWRAMRVFLSLYGTIEAARSRQEVWTELSLARECAALSRDLPANGLKPTRCPLHGEGEILGGLYVAHGAAFGRGVFRHNIMKSLPQVQQEFLWLLPRKAHWQHLIASLEVQGGTANGYDAILRGACAAFQATADIAAFFAKG